MSKILDGSRSILVIDSRSEVDLLSLPSFESISAIMCFLLPLNTTFLQV